MNRLFRHLTWPAAIYVAYVYLWNEQYKLTGHPAAVGLFTLFSDWVGLPGHEQFFRFTTAGAEITAALLILVPITRAYGAILSLIMISVAIMFHTVGPLGVDPAHDGGRLFLSACLTWILSTFIIFVGRDRIAETLIGNLRKIRLKLSFR